MQSYRPDSIILNDREDTRIDTTNSLSSNFSVSNTDSTIIILIIIIILMMEVVEILLSL